MQPLLSIVIANYNYGRFLEDAIRSVVEQDGFDECELIIVDGGSTDNSVDVIRKYKNRISWWVSEKDKGQSNAFNKGFAHAKGKYLTWLNADDVFFPGTLRKIINLAAQKPSCEWMIGGGMRLDVELRVDSCYPARPLSRCKVEAGEVMVYGPSSIFAKSLLERVGGSVDERFHYEMDIELWDRFVIKGRARYEILPGYCWGLRLHKDAKMSGHDFDGSPTSDPKHPAWRQKRMEHDLICEMYQTHPLTFFRRVFSVAIFKWLEGKLDTLRLRGRLYTEVAK